MLALYPAQKSCTGTYPRSCPAVLGAQGKKTRRIVHAMRCDADGIALQTCHPLTSGAELPCSLTSDLSPLVPIVPAVYARAAGDAARRGPVQAAHEHLRLRGRPEERARGGVRVPQRGGAWPKGREGGGQYIGVSATAFSAVAHDLTDSVRDGPVRYAAPLRPA